MKRQKNTDAKIQGNSISIKKLAETMNILGLTASVEEKGTPDEFILVKDGKLEWHIWSVKGFSLFSKRYNWETCLYCNDTLIYDSLNHLSALEVLYNIQDDVNTFHVEEQAEATRNINS